MVPKRTKKGECKQIAREYVLKLMSENSTEGLILSSLSFCKKDKLNSILLSVGNKN